MSGSSVLEVQDLVKHFPVLRGVLRRAVAHVKLRDAWTEARRSLR